MQERFSVSLPEAMLLAAIDEFSGTMRGEAELRYGLAGAMMIELGLHGRLTTDGRNLTVTDRARTGDALLDEALRIMRQAGSTRPPRTWLLRITRALYDLQERYLARLAQAGVLHVVETGALGLFTERRYALLAPGQLYAVRERLRQIALADAPAAPREVALFRLLEACDLIDTQFARSEARAARRWLLGQRRAERFSRPIAAEVASLRRDSANFAYIVGIG
ncbi:MAG TPA: GPP34 family phosphoprotein [Roseiflexaceae bacterium]|nr:GPP34 family phosphoprotein [Roseiflexaceae bacterium]